MTIDFDQFFMFKMFGDPLVLFGDPQKNCLVTPLVTSLVTPFGDPQWRSPKVTKKNTMNSIYSRMIGNALRILGNGVKHI